jgi:hypothetical protein
LNWTRIAIPTLTLAIGAGGTAAGFALAGGQADTGRSPAVSQRATPPTGQNADGAGTSGHAGSGGGGMMSGGGGMMGGGSDIARGTSGGLVPAARMQALAARAAREVTRIGSALRYHTKAVTLVAVGAPGNRPGMYWQIDGVDGPAGPTVSVPADATVTVEFADGDPGHPHGFELTTAAPPYHRMAMMQGAVAAPGAFVMPVPPPQGNLWYAATISFKAPAPGAYHIICPVPGHAQQGMWATFIVR